MGLMVQFQRFRPTVAVGSWRQFCDFSEFSLFIMAAANDAHFLACIDVSGCPISLDSPELISLLKIDEAIPENLKCGGIRNFASVREMKSLNHPFQTFSSHF